MTMEMGGRHFSIVVHRKGTEFPVVVFPVDAPEVTIGRMPPCELILHHGGVAKRHARIVMRDDKLIIVDLKSTNGTFVNGHRVRAPVVLKRTDTITISDYTLTLVDREESAEMRTHIAPTGSPQVSIPDDAIRVSAPVERVTLYEDRAEVTRTATVALEGNSSTLVFDDITTLASEALTFVSVAVQDGDGVVHVDDVRISRRRVTDGDESIARQRELQAEIEEAARVVEERHGAVITLGERARVTRDLMQRFAQHTSTTAGQASLDPMWKSRFSELTSELRRLTEMHFDAQKALLDAKTEHARIDGLVKAHRQLATRARADAVLRLSGRAARVRVTLSSVVPCALWRPSHDAALASSSSGDGDVEFTTYATVWQKTGEAWRDVELVFSTARPSAGAVLPVLGPDVLTTREKTAEERRTVIVEHRQEAVPRHENEGAAPGVDDGGETRTYRAHTRASIPTDGRPHPVEVARFTVPAKLERIAVPEMSPLVFLRASFVNAGQGPILAGPVTLKENGAYVGVGDVLYVGQGENLDLSFGSDDRFRVRHEQRRVVEEKLIGKDEVTFVSETTLFSMSRAVERVVVLTRFPVSEVDKLTVTPSLPHCTDGEPKLDAHGLARLAVDVQPFAEKKISLGFRWKTSGDVRIPDPW
jgi:uncharacterized protein (TIGR02231 family)